MQEAENWDSTQGFMDEISYEQIQELMDQIMGDQSFDFGKYVGSLVRGKTEGSLTDILHTIWNGLCSSMLQDKELILSLLVIALVGALFTNFSKLLQGKQVAQTAFFVIYLLFFSVLGTSFYQISQMAAETMDRLLDFVKVLVPTFMISLSFTQGGAAAGVYYEFTLMMIAVVNWILVKAALPAVNLYFFLQVANQLSQEDMFSKMAELIRDVVRLAVKTMFGLMMGMNVIQGLIVPVTVQVKNMAVTRMGSAIPGVGNTVSSVLQTVLCAGTLVKNAVGVTGLIVVFVLCAVPLLQMVASQLLYQVVAAMIQPISDSRLVQGLSGTVDAIKLLVYIVSVGAMLFITSIAMISAFTT